MINYLFLFLFICFFTDLQAQVGLRVPIVDTCFSKQEIINIADDIRLKSERINKLETFNSVLIDQSNINDRLHYQDSMYIDIQMREILMLERQVEIQKETYKRKWYQSPILNFVGGMVAVTLGAVVIDLATN